MPHAFKQRPVDTGSAPNRSSRSRDVREPGSVKGHSEIPAGVFLRAGQRPDTGGGMGGTVPNKLDEPHAPMSSVADELLAIRQNDCPKFKDNGGWGGSRTTAMRLASPIL